MYTKGTFNPGKASNDKEKKWTKNPGKYKIDRSTFKASGDDDESGAQENQMSLKEKSFDDRYIVVFVRQ